MRLASAQIASTARKPATESCGNLDRRLSLRHAGGLEVGFSVQKVDLHGQRRTTILRPERRHAADDLGGQAVHLDQWSSGEQDGALHHIA